MAAQTSGAHLRALGAEIRKRRIEAGLTQEQLGRRSGIGGRYVSEIERGTRDLPFSTLHAIARGLGRVLDVKLDEDGRSVGHIGLPRNVVRAAEAIAELSDGKRTMVLAILRDALALASSG